MRYCALPFLLPGYQGVLIAQQAMPVPQTNRWHPVMLPDNYIRKMRQDLAEIEAQVESKTRYEPDPDFSPPPVDEDTPAP